MCKFYGYYFLFKKKKKSLTIVLLVVKKGAKQTFHFFIGYTRWTNEIQAKPYSSSTLCFFYLKLLSKKNIKFYILLQKYVFLLCLEYTILFPLHQKADWLHNRNKSSFIRFLKHVLIQIILGYYYYWPQNRHPFYSLCYWHN